ncbi:hypothetical protein [Pseudomonas sp. 9Ag]|uniref:hypothetical protein n=1 Tax=Pseudomonas sp. 9Ag TaxID=2653167 RepID=UPI0012EF29EA|nr:hypothetical protein [Pseudomonas sp. 9Ag]VXC50831.1 conserved hypothetical protein [Pseudomonas sp. 9Ag]
MADLESGLLPFPYRPKSPSSPSFSASVPARQSVLAEAELRADMVKDLLQQIGGPDGFYPQDLRLKMTLYAAEALLDEMVVLYRRAVSGTATS